MGIHGIQTIFDPTAKTWGSPPKQKYNYYR